MVRLPMKNCCHALKRIAGYGSLYAYFMFGLSLTYLLVLTHNCRTQLWPLFRVLLVPPHLTESAKGTYWLFSFAQRHPFFLIIPTRHFHQHLRNFIVTLFIVHVHGEFWKTWDLLSGGLGLGLGLGHRLGWMGSVMREWRVFEMGDEGGRGSWMGKVAEYAMTDPHARCADQSSVVTMHFYYRIASHRHVHDNQISHKWAMDSSWWLWSLTRRLRVVLLDPLLHHRRRV